jgi:uncharacterized protein with PIN domain
MNPPENICFVAESTLGKLSKWLRILGFDAIFEAHPMQPATSDRHRIRLTRSQTHGEARKDEQEGLEIVILSDHYQEQLKQVIKTLNIQEKTLKPFSRCIRCNEPIKSIDRESVIGKVPDYIFKTHRSFWTCRMCRRIFWPGTHHNQSMDRIKQLFED